MISLKQIGLALVLFAAGAAVGALFYPSKRVAEKERTIQELRAEKERVEARVSELEAKTRETTVTIERPDGTKQTKKVLERDVVRHSESQARETEHEVQKTETEKERVTETNPRHFSIAAGIRTTGVYFLHADADLVSALFVAVETDTRGVFGVGLGFRF